MKNDSDLKEKWRELKDNIKDFWAVATSDKTRARDDQQHVMSDDEKIDEAIAESFPASDPPGHFSKSPVDKDLH